MLEPVNIIKGEKVKEKLLSGSKQLADAVATTFGPNSNNVAITMFYNLPHVTKDGVTVTNSINLEDPIENVACQIIKEAAKKTADVAGDGTTSTTLLTYYIVEEVNKVDYKNYNKLLLKKELDKLISTVDSLIDNVTQEISSEEDIKRVAMVASNGDEEISDMIVDIFKVIGKDGIVSVADSKNYDTKIDVMEGIKLDRVYIDFSLSDGKSKESYIEAFIVTTDLDITTMEDAIHLVALQETHKKPLLVICNDIHQSALQIIAYNKIQRGVPIEVIRGPHIAQARKEAINDISIATGATFIAKDLGWTINNITHSHFGKCNSFDISSKETNIFGRLGNPDLIEERINYYRDKIENGNDGLQVNYQKRLAMLNSGAAVIYVGGSNEIEVKEKKDRLDDTIRAVKSALEYGVVKGGTLTYLNICLQLDNKKIPEFILLNSLSKLVSLFMDNSNYSLFDELQQSVDKNNIIDPSIVVKSVIKNAIGAASMIFTTECVIVKLKQD